MDYGIERVSCASDQHLVFSADYGDVSSVRLTDWIQSIPSETADRHESRRLRRCFIHRRRTLDDKIKDTFVIK
jgi:hypothetical protein